jgi:hypothetical protein
VAGVLKALGYALDVVAGILQDIFSLAADVLEDILGGVGYALDAIADFFDDIGCDWFGIGC